MIRAAFDRDLTGILEILNHHILHSTAIWSETPFTMEEMRNWFADRVNNGYPVIVKVSESDEILGYGTYSMFRAKSGYRFCVEHSIYVNKDFQQRSIGSELMQELIRTATQQGMHTMVGGIEASNTQSIRFHKKFGFEETGRLPEVGQKFGRWLDLVFMQKTL